MVKYFLLALVYVYALWRLVTLIKGRRFLEPEFNIWGWFVLGSVFYWIPGMPAPIKIAWGIASFFIIYGLARYAAKQLDVKPVHMHTDHTEAEVNIQEVPPEDIRYEDFGDVASYQDDVRRPDSPLNAQLKNHDEVKQP